MKNLIFYILLMAISIGSTPSLDNFATLMLLKESAMVVIEQNQELIDSNKDGRIIPKGINKKYIAKNTYSAFLKQSKGTDWDIRSLKGSHDKNQLATALTVFLAQARVVIAKAQPIINKDADGSVNPKNFYPAVFGRLTADEFFKQSGIKLKQTTLGKGLGARNTQYNSPDAWEAAALKKLSKVYQTSKTGFGEEINSDNKKVYRHIYPLVIKKACLGCHGDPKGEKDISGYVREGYQVGELRGGISIVIP